MDINTKKVGNMYEPTSVDMDPYSEYVHPQQTTETFHQTVDVKQLPEKPQDDEYVPLQGVAQLNRNIDDFFDGVDMFFNLTDRVMDRIGGNNARRRKNIK